MPSQTRPSAAQQRLAAKLEAAASERRAAASRRRRIKTVGIPILVVVLVVAVLVVVKVATGAGDPKSGKKATTATSTVITAVTSVPASALNTVGAGSVVTQPKAISGAALSANGLPQVLYIGAEYCPYCAAERWAVAVALSRFGTFTGLGQTASSPSDVYPSTATLTFHGASYTSKYLSFTGKEIQSNQVVNGTYATLDTLTADEKALLTKYDSGGGIPFIDIGGNYMISGASYNPQVLQGNTHAEIAAALSDPSSPIAKGVDGTANAVTAAVCASTGNTPASVCTASGVVAAAKKL
ncbi:DUF929 family protein [uncultured Jatrophihabitans sp.]|uniref:DUF929 family protein n=1 Tax=uncultured Jatrophihabitans sp. TaxID=1610747 RepID=UPI0035CA79A4